MSDIVRQYVNFRFFKTLPEWRRLSEAEREKGRKEFADVVKEFQKKMFVIPYSLIGIRAEADFMFWRISERLETINECSAAMLKTTLGKYISIPVSYISVTKRSMYVDKHQHEGAESSRAKIVPGNAKYLFVYPFVKTREWYLLSKEERQKIMDVHIAMGHKYPSVKINTTYSFGIDDQEFVVAFESDSPMDFVDLVMELRETQSSKYTVRDTPAFTCIKKSIEEVLKDIG